MRIDFPSAEILRHYSSRPLKRMRTIEQSQEPDWKPHGLWVSVDGNGDGWPEWCQAESYCDIRAQIAHQIILCGDANILRIDSAEGIDGLTATYGKQFPFVREGVDRIDWGAIAQEYDGIIIAPYIHSRRFCRVSRWYYPWDCASGCIWNARAVECIEVEQAVKR